MVIIIEVVPPVRVVKQLTFLALPRVPNVTQHLAKPTELRCHGKPQEGLAKETQAEEGRIAQEIAVQQVSETTSHDQNGLAATNQNPQVILHPQVALSLGASYYFTKRVGG